MDKGLAPLILTLPNSPHVKRPRNISQTIVACIQNSKQKKNQDQMCGLPFGESIGKVSNTIIPSFATLCWNPSLETTYKMVLNLKIILKFYCLVSVLKIEVPRVKTFQCGICFLNRMVRGRFSRLLCTKILAICLTRSILFLLVFMKINSSCYFSLHSFNMI